MCEVPSKLNRGKQEIGASLKGRHDASRRPIGEQLSAEWMVGEKRIRICRSSAARRWQH